MTLNEYNTLKEAIYKLLELEGSFTYGQLYNYLDISKVSYHPSDAKTVLDNIIKSDDNVYRKKNGTFIYKNYKATSSVENEKLVNWTPIKKKTLTSEVEEIISNFALRSEFSSADIYDELDKKGVEYKKTSVSPIVKKIIDSGSYSISRVGKGKFRFE